jgi:predicted nucleic acid-binding protein
MPTVANTPAVMNLAIIGHLALPREHFGEVLVPRAVVEEPWLEV